MNPVEYFLSKGWVKKSGYGSRTDPVTRQPGVFHYGIDVGGKPAGEPICTPFAGTVRASGYYGNAGNAISIKSAKTGLMLLFFHLQTRTVRPGQVVKAGDIIGTNGSTGKSTGPHLHFEIRHDKGILFGSSRPAWGDPEKYEEVDAVSEELKKAIDWFVQKGVISDPELWMETAVAGKMVKGENVASFILKAEQKLRS